MIDIGLNLTSEQFSKDRDVVINNALEAGLKGFILTGTSCKTTREANKICIGNTNIFRSTSGVHPHDAKNWHISAKTIEEIAQKETTVAVGECGLDYDRMFSTREEQMFAFEEQLKIALKFNKPVFLHVRPKNEPESVKEILNDFKNIFDPYHQKGVKGIVHCFTGNKKTLDMFIAYGLYIGITGWVCDDKRGEQLQKLIKYIPNDKIMIETDAPYLTPKNMPKKLYNRRNEPAFLGYVLDKVSELKEISPEQLKKITNENVKTLFNWNPGD